MESIKPTKKLNKIRALLGIDVVLEQIALDNGVVFEAESFEPGQPVFVVAEGERMPVPVGEFELPDGRVLVVVEEGVISEMKSMEEEAPAEEQPQEMDAAPEATAKKVVEEVRKETHFSADDFSALVARVEALEAKLAEAETEDVVEEEKVEVEASAEVVAEEPEVKTVKHSPELVKQTNTYAKRFGRPETMAERVLKHLYN